MGTCEPGQGLTAAAISSHPFVRWASHRRPSAPSGITAVARPADDNPGPTAGGYRVVARRYRPQTFGELIGQEHVARGLAGAITTGRVGHAYLFTGARGVGKTSAARVLAKALQCRGSRDSSAEPCNACESCRDIAAGQDVDVVEIDAASNRGIDEIRQLRQNVAIRPARGSHKIYIIDEVHMLTREAFNALLKTLEEPPAHVKFVLCTTEPEKLPITILSRCQRFDFLNVDTAAIEGRLAEIAAAEGVAIDPQAVRLIAARAAGSMRDSQSLLEQLLAVSAERIGIDDVHAILGTGRDEGIAALVEAILGGNPGRAVEAVAAATAGGADAGGLLEQLLGVLRDAMLASVGCEPRGSGGIDASAIGRELGTETILAMMQIIDHTLGRMRLAGHAEVLAEMAVVRLASLENLESIAAVVRRLEGTGGGSPADRGGKTARGEQKKKPDHRGSDQPEEVAAVGTSVGRMPEKAGAASQIAPEPLELWRQVGQSVGGIVEGFVAEAASACWREDVLEVTFPAAAEPACSFLRRPEVAASIAAAVESLAGRSRHKLFVQAAAESNGSDPGRPPIPPAGGASRSQAALVREAREHPFVEQATRLFDAAIRRVDAPAEEPAGTTPAADR